MRFKKNVQLLDFRLVKTCISLGTKTNKSSDLHTEHNLENADTENSARPFRGTVLG